MMKSRIWPKTSPSTLAMVAVSTFCVSARTAPNLNVSLSADWRSAHALEPRVRQVAAPGLGGRPGRRAPRRPR